MALTQWQLKPVATDTIASGDFVAFTDEGESGDPINKLTVDNLMETGLPLVTEDAIADGDYILFLDGGATGNTNKEAVHDLATLFAGAGMTATSSVLNVIGGDGITANANDVAITAAQTTVTSVYNASLKMGRDSQNLIDFATTDNKIILRVNNVDEVELVENALSPVTASGVDLGTTSLEWGNIYIGDDKKVFFGDGQDASIEYDEDGTDELRIAGDTIFEDHVSLTAGKLLKIGATTEADAFSTDDTAYGVTVTFEAGGTVTLGRAVYIDSNGQVQHPDVEASGGVTASPAIGIATNGGSSGDTIYVLVLGIFREVSEFDLTAGGAIYLSDATNGKLTGTAPNDDGDLVQRMGVALSADMAFIMPSIDQIEHA